MGGHVDLDLTSLGCLVLVSGAPLGRSAHVERNTPGSSVENDRKTTGQAIRRCDSRGRRELNSASCNPRDVKGEDQRQQYYRWPGGSGLHLFDVSPRPYLHLDTIEPSGDIDFVPSIEF